MISAREALQRLREGNRRFISGSQAQSARPARPRRAELEGAQHPLAIIVGCSDSRVPPELLFDQGVGDLFVVRVAGNLAGPTQVGSVEFAAGQFGTRLVVVLGHSQCGAIEAALEHIQASVEVASPDIQSIVELLRPSIEPLLETEAVHDRDELLRQAVRANVLRWTGRLRSSGVLGRLMSEDGLLVVGAEYSLETRAVEFFEDDRETRQVASPTTRADPGIDGGPEAA